MKQKKPTDLKKLTRKNDTAEKTMVGETQLQAKTKNPHLTRDTIFKIKEKHAV